MPEGSTVAELESVLGIDTEYSPAFLVNGRRLVRGARLFEGDAVTVVSLMAGG